jgi:oleate hydratase
MSNLSIGSMAAPPQPRHGRGSTSWQLWRTLASRRRDFGDPSTYADHVEDSTWVSFTVTDRGSLFARLMEDFTGRDAGRGGLVTFKGSNWLMTLARFHQPNSVDQPPDIFLWWGYGIYPEKPGNFVKKPMLECSGAEIMREVLCHLKFDEDAEAILGSSICIPCLMPFAGSVCLRRKMTDRPKVIPAGSTNLAFIGQFCEIPQDVVFTMEYSVRSARMAVQGLLHTGREPPTIYRGYYDPRVLYRAFRALNR